MHLFVALALELVVEDAGCGGRTKVSISNRIMPAAGRNILSTS